MSKKIYRCTTCRYPIKVRWMWSLERKVIKHYFACHNPHLSFKNPMGVPPGFLFGEW